MSMLARLHEWHLHHYLLYYHLTSSGGPFFYFPNSMKLLSPPRARARGLLP